MQQEGLWIEWHLREPRLDVTQSSLHYPRTPGEASSGCSPLKYFQALCYPGMHLLLSFFYLLQAAAGCGTFLGALKLLVKVVLFVGALKLLLAVEHSLGALELLMEVVLLLWGSEAAADCGALSRGFDAADGEDEQDAPSSQLDGSSDGADGLLTVMDEVGLQSVSLPGLQIDDPAVAWSCHGISGIWGVLFVGFFAKEAYIQEVYQIAPGQHKMGLFYGGHGQLLLCQFISIVVNHCMGGILDAQLLMAPEQMFWMYGFFWLLNKLGMLRISLGTEALGLDHAAMGENNTRGLLSNDLIIKPNTAAAAMGARMIPEDEFDFEKLKNPMPDGYNK
eukprot:gene8505-biopygen2713